MNEEDLVRIPNQDGINPDIPLYTAPSEQSYNFWAQTHPMEDRDLAFPEKFEKFMMFLQEERPEEPVVSYALRMPNEKIDLTEEEIASIGVS